MQQTNSIAVKCPSCDGSGLKMVRICERCKGSGEVRVAMREDDDVISTVEVPYFGEKG